MAFLQGNQRHCLSYFTNGPVVFTAVQANDAQFYDVIVSGLTPENQNQIQEIINEANRKQQANGMWLCCLIMIIIIIVIIAIIIITSSLSSSSLS